MHRPSSPVVWRFLFPTVENNPCNLRRNVVHYILSSAGVMELVDVVDSKSTASDGVPVRVRPPAPCRRKLHLLAAAFLLTGHRCAHPVVFSFPKRSHRAFAVRWPVPFGYKRARGAAACCQPFSAVIAFSLFNLCICFVRSFQDKLPDRQGVVCQLFVNIVCLSWCFTKKRCTIKLYHF